MSNSELEEAMRAAEECAIAREAQMKAAKAAKEQAKDVEIPVEIEEDSNDPSIEIDTEEPANNTQINLIQAEFDKKDKEIADLKNALLLSQANLENYRKRAEKELADARKYSSGKVIADFIPVMDNFRRAIEHLPKSDDESIKNINSGIKMIQESFDSTLKRYGVERFESLGHSFDPNIHEALSQMPTADYEPGCVCQVFEDGYMIHDHLLRAAKVIVACPLPETSSEEQK